MMISNIDYSPAPGSVIRILKDVPLDNTYRNLIDWANYKRNGFNSEQAFQENWMVGKTKYAVTDANYQRIDRYLAVKINAEDLLDCNYLMYKNANFSDKWFYAFITKVEYRGEHVSYVYFEIDVHQTFFMEINWKPSYIEREHVSDDSIGKNLVPEDLDTGEIIYKSEWNDETLSELSCIVCTTAKGDQNVVGGVYNGIYSGAKMYCFPIVANEAKGLNEFLAELDAAGKGGAVSNIFTIPSVFVKYDQTTHEVSTGYTGKDVILEVPIDLQTIAGYTPKNNKLFQYPYNMLKVTNMNGTNALYKFEYFPGVSKDKKKANFQVSCALSTVPTLFCVPQEYKLGDVSTAFNYDMYLPLTNYPNVNWTYGTFANWYAQNAAAYQYAQLKGGLEVVGGTAQAGAGLIGGIVKAVATKNPGAVFGDVGAGVSTALGGVDTIITNMIDKYQHSIEPNQSKGGSGGSGANVAAGIQNFFFYQMTITKEYAERIDSFFSYYGYKVNRFDKPNTKSRYFWNYIKTIDANLEISIPQPYFDKLKEIFNNGTTIWHTPYISQYDLINRVRGVDE